MLRILHLSDTHFFGDDARHYGVVDTAEHLERVLAAVAEESFDVVICSGDVSEDGSAESYRRVQRMLGDWASARGAAAVFAMGNHDRRETFREVLGGADAAGAVTSIHEVSGWRIVVLDSSIPGRGDGAIGPEQRAWAAAELAVPAEHGTIIVVHHAPIAAQTDLLQALTLRSDDADWLMRTARDAGVRAILSGHYHLPLVEVMSGIPVIVTPGVANIARSVGDRRTESAANAYGGTIVELTATGVRAAPFIAGDLNDEVFHFDQDTVARIIAEAAP